MGRSPQRGPGSPSPPSLGGGAGLSHVPAAQLVPELLGAHSAHPLWEPTCTPSRENCLRGGCDRRLGRGTPGLCVRVGVWGKLGSSRGPLPPHQSSKATSGRQLWTTERGGDPCSGTLVCRERLAGVECLYFPVPWVVGHRGLGLGVQGEACPPPSLRAETCGSCCREEASSEVTRPELLPPACLPAGPGLRTLCIPPWGLHGYPWRWAPWSPPPQGEGAGRRQPRSQARLSALPTLPLHPSTGAGSCCTLRQGDPQPRRAAFHPPPE